MKNVHTVETVIEKKEWADILDKVFKKKNSETTIKGFRKGKAPKAVFMKEFGIETLFMDAADEALAIAYDKTMKDSKLEPVVEPKVDIKEIDDKHIKFEFTIITKPEVKVSSYKNLGVKKEKAKVTKKEIEEELNTLRSRYAERVEKENGKVDDGDIAIIDFEGFVNGKAFEGGKGTDYPLEIGSNTFIPGFEEGLKGAKKGDKVDVKVKFPENYVENLAGKEAVFKCEVKKIEARVLPKLDKDFFEDLGFEDVNTKEELEKKIEEHLMEHKNEEVENKYLDDLMNAGIAKMKVEVNDEIVDAEVNRMLGELDERLQMQGMTAKQYFEFTKTTMEDFRKQTEPVALNRIKSRYLLDYIIEKENLKATAKEVEKHAEEQSKKYGINKEEFVSMYGGMEVVKYDLLIHKAVKVLENN